MTIIHADHVETPLAFMRQVAKIFFRYSGKRVLFVAVHRSLGRLYIARRASLDFDEAEDVFLPRYEIDFSSAEWRAEVAGHHYIAMMTPQIEIRVFFAAFSGS